MKAKIPRVMFFKDAVSIKDKNTRVTAVDCEDGLILKFEIICTNPSEERATHWVKRNKVCGTGIKVSNSSLFSMLYCVLNRMNISEIKVLENGLDIQTKEQIT